MRALVDEFRRTRFLRPLLGVIALAAHITWAAAAQVSVEVDGTTVALHSDGAIGRVEHFVLRAPKRLVVDLYGVSAAAQARDVALTAGFRRLRLGAYPDKARFVFDVAGDHWPSFDIAEQPQRRRVVVTWRTGPAGAAPPGDSAPATPPADQTDSPVAAAAPMPPADRTQPPASGREAAPGRRYSDVRTTLVYDDADVKDVLRRIAAVSGRRIVVDEAVSGRVMLRLVDVPWDQALEMVLSITRLRVMEDGDVLRVMPPPAFGGGATPGAAAQEFVGTSLDGSHGSR